MKEITVGAYYSIWQRLSERYYILEMTQILSKFISDIDFKFLVDQGIQILEKEIDQMENIAKEFGIITPIKTPVNTPIQNINKNLFRDELIFRFIYQGTQDFLYHHIRTIIVVRNSELRNKFLAMLDKEKSLFKKLEDYGSLKGWLSVPPYTQN